MDTGDTAASKTLFVEPYEYATFPGGDAALIDFFDENLNETVVCAKNLKEGVVFASFTIDTLGAVTDIAILKSYNKAIDNELVRVLELMPRWNPGRFKTHNMQGPWVKIPNKFNKQLSIPHCVE